MRRPSFAIALWMLWAFVLLASYYQRAWGLVFMGPSRWIDENSSLRSALELLSLLKNAGVPWRQPAFDEALARTLFAIWGASLVLAAALALGTVVCRLLRFRANDGRDALLYRVSAGFGAIAYGSLLLAAAGIYHAHLIRMLVAVPAAAGVSWFLYSRIRLPRERRAEVSAPLPGRRFSYDWLWRAVSLLALGFAFVSALAPEIEYDALWYHLWLPKVWMEHGRPVDIVSEFISLYPLTWELVFQAGVVFGGPVAGKLLHFAALLLCGLAVFQLARRVGVGVPPWLAVAFFFTVPTVLWEATTAYVDLALTLHVSLAIHALLHYIEGRRGDWFALAVLNLGLALATKHLGLFALLILFNGLLLQLWLRDRNFRRVLVPCVVLAAVSLLFPLPWYLRNWLASGNPVFPDLYSLFGASPIERWNDMTEAGWRNFEAQFGRPRTLVNELTLPWDVTVHAARYGGAFGPLFLLFLPGLALVRRWSPALIWVTAFVVVYVALWCSPLNGRELRFLIPLTPLLAVAGA
ncbi:MAG: hypothetical protein ACRD21_19065, partial [Vicinamibacteria bacterium]